MTITTSFMSPPVDECLDCQGNFRFLQHLGKRIVFISVCTSIAYEMCSPFCTFAAIPVFPRPNVSDTPINPINSPLQFNGTGKYRDLVRSVLGIIIQTLTCCTTSGNCRRRVTILHWSTACFTIFRRGEGRAWERGYWSTACLVYMSYTWFYQTFTIVLLSCRPGNRFTAF